MRILYLTLLLASCVILSLSRTAEEWKTRTIYQLLTDRFARTDDLLPACEGEALFDYCGGTFKGIEKNLDYITGMGFNAIWISPIIKNAPKGYHGYWHLNLYEVNENFGTEQDFHDLMKACHDRDVWVMVDVVPNHMRPHEDGQNVSEFSDVVPFNSPEHYHFPILPCAGVFANDSNNQTAMEICWLWKLPDLNHENPYVAKTLVEWIGDFVSKYQIDGLRVDATRHVPKDFQKKFAEAAGVFTVGEVFKDDASYCATYQGTLDSLLNFPLQSRLHNTLKKGSSMMTLSKYFTEEMKVWPDHTVLANFVSNHDFDRFLSVQPVDKDAFKASYAFILSTVGIPALYYGDEQMFNGGHDPANREPLWGKMNRDSEVYKYIRDINFLRSRTEFYKFEQVERLADDNIYAFTRGPVFFAFSNTVGEQVRIIKNHNYPPETILCNTVDDKECVQVVNGEFTIKLVNKHPKILAPAVVSGNNEGLGSALKSIKEAVAEAIQEVAATANIIGGAQNCEL